MRRFVAVLIVCSFIASGLFWWQQSAARTYQTAKVSIGDKVTVAVQVAKTSKQVTQGLSGRQPLGETNGMLFVMGASDQWTFWMKDMLFDLDFIWINHGQVVGVSKQISHPLRGETPATVQPLIPADQVLEVNAGFVDQYNVQTDDVVRINID